MAGTNPGSTAMHNSSGSNPFIKYDATYQKMNNIHNEIKQLCNAGRHDEAQQ